MRRTYQYNEKSDKKGAYGYDASQLVGYAIRNNNSRYFSERRSIEEQIDKTAEIVGNLCDILVSKGLMTHEEFLKALDLEYSHESRDVIDL